MGKDGDPFSNSKAVTKALSSVGSTVEVYADRMRRKLKEQEELDDQSKKASDARHALILQALTTIRRALLETQKIKISDRFHFELHITDWEGWPRLDLNLIDELNPEILNYALMVTAHDRDETGLIQMSLRSGESVGRVMLKDPHEFEKLPVVLKRAIRRFLEIVTPYILQPSMTGGHKQANPEAIAEESATTKALGSADLFMEDDLSDDNRVASPASVRPLTDIGS